MRTVIGTTPPSVRVNPFVRLVRLGNTIVSFAGTIVGGLDARGHVWNVSLSFLVVLVLAGLSTACVTAGGNVLNDILDRRSDATNHPDRPLVTGAISVRSARALATGLLIAAWVLIVPIVLAAPLLLPILAIAEGSVLTYEFRFKVRGLAGNLLVALLTGLVFIYGGAAAGNLILVVPFALMAFFATLSREVIKDMEDVAGDVDRRTLPRTHGMGLSSIVARSTIGAAIALSVIPVLTYLRVSSPAGIMYSVLVLAADGLFFVSVIWLPRRLHTEQTVSKGAMTVALLAFLASAFR
jgi:geranylgeranylglycerol-phosphate geranylgeranyltransferase